MVVVFFAHYVIIRTAVILLIETRLIGIIALLYELNVVFGRGRNRAGQERVALHIFETSGVILTTQAQFHEVKECLTKIRPVLVQRLDVRADIVAEIFKTWIVWVYDFLGDHLINAAPY